MSQKPDYRKTGLRPQTPLDSDIKCANGKLIIVKSVMIDLSEVFLIFTALPQVQSREYHVDIHRAKD